MNRCVCTTYDTVAQVKSDLIGCHRRAQAIIENSWIKLFETAWGELYGKNQLSTVGTYAIRSDHCPCPFNANAIRHLISEPKWIFFILSHRRLHPSISIAWQSCCLLYLYIPFRICVVRCPVSITSTHTHTVTHVASSHKTCWFCINYYLSLRFVSVSCRVVVHAPCTTIPTLYIFAYGQWAIECVWR